MNLLDLVVKVTVDDSGVDSGLNKITSSFEKVKNNVGSVIKTASKIGAVVTTVGTALTAVGVDTAAEVRAEASAFEQTFGDMQDTATKAIGRVAEESGILQTRLNSLGSKIYAFARSSGGDATESMNLMERALKAAADSAAYYDTSVEQATETLQSFLKGNFANDAALGLSATETTRNAAAMELFGQKYNELSEIQKQETLLKMVEDSQKLSGALGQASREADGWENVLGNLKETWRQFQANAGAPFLESLIPIIQKITTAFQGWINSVDWDTFTANITGFVNTVLDNGDTIISVIAGIATGFVAWNVASIIQSVVGAIKAFQAANEGATIAQAALNLVMNANPIGIVITAVAALAASVIALWHTNDDFRNAVISAWEKIKDTISNAVASIKTFFTETIPNAGRTAVKWFQSIPDQMRDVGRNLLMGLWNGISDKIAWLKSKVTGVVDTIQSWFTGKRGFDEHSPSKWANGVAKYVMQGMADGFENGLPSLMDSVGGITDRIKNGLDFGTASIDYSTSATGSLARAANRSNGDEMRPIVIDFTAQLDGKTLVRQMVPIMRNEVRSAGAAII